MKKLISNVLMFMFAIFIVALIINCQKAQRTSNIEPEVLGIGQHKAVYYQYLDYMEGRE